MSIKRPNTPTPASPETKGLSLSPAARFRMLIAMAVTALAVSATACKGEGGNSEETGGTGNVTETGGEAGSDTGGTGNEETGGTGNADTGGSGNAETGGEAGSDTGGTGNADTGGTGGTGGSDDPCEGIEFNGLASITLEPGESGSAIVDVPIDDADALYNGGGVYIPGHILREADADKTAKYVARKLYVDNAPAGYNVIRSESGFDIVAVDATRQMVDDGQGIGNCVPNELRVNPNLDVSERPTVLSPTGIFGTTVHRSDATGDLELPGNGHTSFITAEGTESQVSGFSEYTFVNSNPEVVAEAIADEDGIVTINLTGTMDENQSDSTIYQGLQLEANGYTFSQVEGQPHLWRSDSPLPPGTHEIQFTLTGLSGSEQDQTVYTVTVTVNGTNPCESVECNNGTCNGGACECDPGYTPDDDCAGTRCDEAGGYMESNDTPGTCVDNPCDPDPDICNGNGVCVPDNSDAASCECDTGHAGSDCGSCDTASGYIESNDTPGECVDDPCDPDPDICNDKGTCVVDASDQASCECDTGHAGSDCNSCDTAGGYVASNATPGECVDDPCAPDPCGEHSSACDLDSNDAAECTCTDGYTGDSCETPPPAPEISNLGIDCSGGSFPGYCVAYGETYPVNFDTTNAVSWSATAEVTSGTGTEGSFPVVSGSISGPTTTIDYTTGDGTNTDIRITITVENAYGGTTEQYIDFTIY